MQEVLLPKGAAQLTTKGVTMLKTFRSVKGLAVVSAMAAILGIADSVSGLVIPISKPPGGVKVVTKSGKGGTTNSTSISSNGSTSDCTKLRAIVAAASIGGTLPTNDSITAEATCGDAALDVTAPPNNTSTDPFVVEATEVTSTTPANPPATCNPNYAGVENRAWTITCVFLFN
jgi:hypothetical protein